MVTYNPSESEEKTLTAEAPPTPELNPYLLIGSINDKVSIEYVIFDRDIVGNPRPKSPTIPYDDAQKITTLSWGIKNRGDELIYAAVSATIDGKIALPTWVAIPPGANSFTNRDLPAGVMGEGTHTIIWILKAKVLGGTEHNYYSDSTTYIVEAPTPPPAHDTALSIDIVNEAGNPITESVVGETVYIAGQLRDIVDNVALQGASIALYRNGVATGKTDITDSSGVYSIPYTVVSGDVPTVLFKTVFGGT